MKDKSDNKNQMLGKVLYVYVIHIIGLASGSVWVTLAGLGLTVYLNKQPDNDLIAKNLFDLFLVANLVLFLNLVLYLNHYYADIDFIRNFVALLLLVPSIIAIVGCIRVLKAIVTP